MSNKQAIVAEPLDRIEQLRCDLLRGLCRRDNRIWQQRQAAIASRVGDEASHPASVAPRYASDGGYDEFHVAVGRVR